ncbi:MAG TPA: hypothetical protein VFE42_27915 [Chloroflexota bacterium]|nr:hypothetical protein [Chloroflexota bacterium]
MHQSELCLFAILKVKARLFVKSHGRRIVQIDQRRYLLDPVSRSFVDQRSVQEQADPPALILRGDADVGDGDLSAEWQRFIREEKGDDLIVERRGEAVAGLEIDREVRPARDQMLFLVCIRHAIPRHAEILALGQLVHPAHPVVILVCKFPDYNVAHVGIIA